MTGLKLKPAMLSGSLLVQKGSATPAAVGPRPAPRKENGSRVALFDGENGWTANDDTAACKTMPRARMSLRIDPVRHLRLKLLSAHLRRSAQEILTAALDAYLDEVAPEVAERECVCLRKDAQSGTESRVAGVEPAYCGEVERPAAEIL